MKILYFHQYFSTPRGTAGSRSYEMARRLVSRGHEVVMVCGSAARSQTELSVPFARGRRRGIVDGIQVIEFDLDYSNSHGLLRRARAFLSYAIRSVNVALTERCDAVFATTTPLTAALPGLAARWLRFKPFVFEVRDLWPELPRAMGIIRNPVVLWAMGALEWAAYRSADALVGLAPGIVDGIARRGVPRSRIALIPNGCDLDIFSSSPDPWRPSGVDPHDLMALFAGAHGQANGLDAVLDAAAELKRHGRSDVKIVLVGEGKLKPLLERRAQTEGLTNVVFHPSVTKDRLAGLMAAADVGLQILDNIPAFYYSTSPNKFFDYIAAGLPVVINYPGWLADLVSEHQCGHVVPPSDPAVFADTLIQIAEDRDTLRPMRERAIGLAQQFDRRILADRFVDWLEKSVAR